jgi:hypothetical protein
MKKQIIFLVPAALFMIALVRTLSAAFASNDEGPGNAGSDVSCDPTTGNPFQEKCDGGGLRGQTTEDGCKSYTGPSTEDHLPRMTVRTC